MRVEVAMIGLWKKRNFARITIESGRYTWSGM